MATPAFPARTEAGSLPPVPGAWRRDEPPGPGAGEGAWGEGGFGGWGGRLGHRDLRSRLCAAALGSRTCVICTAAEQDRSGGVAGGAGSKDWTASPVRVVRASVRCRQLGGGPKEQQRETLRGAGPPTPPNSKPPRARPGCPGDHADYVPKTEPKCPPFAPGDLTALPGLAR